MFVPHAERAASRYFALQLLEQVEHRGVGAITDRMDAGLITGLDRGQRLRVQISRRGYQQAARLRIVAVRLMQRRAAGAECAVGDELDGANREEVMCVIEDRRGQCFARTRRPQHHVHPCLQRSIVCRGAVQRDVVPGDACVVHHRQSEPGREVVGEA